VGCRGHARNNDKDQVLEKKARLDAESRRQVMLSPDALKKELHCWVAHDSRWLTFKSWIEVPPPLQFPRLFASHVSTLHMGGIHVC
jgi:hypothetical protein